MNAKEMFEKIAWETDTAQIHGITGENMLVNDVRGEECTAVRAALTELEEIKKRAEKKRTELECAIEIRQEELAKHRMDEDEVYRTKDAITEFERGIEGIDFIIKGEGK